MIHRSVSKTLSVGNRGSDDYGCVRLDVHKTLTQPIVIYSMYMYIKCITVHGITGIAMVFVFSSYIRNAVHAFKSI